MVLIDGHDSAWQRKFQTAAAAVCSNDASLTGIPAKSLRTANNRQSTNGSENHGDERNKRKIVFMHLNLGHVQWEQLPLQSKLTNDTKGHDQPYRFLAVEVVDCTGLEEGLPFIFQLPLRHLYVSTTTIVSPAMGSMLAEGLRNSCWTLQKLQLSSATFSPTSVHEFARGLKHATTLQELNLSYCLFHGEDDEVYMVDVMLDRSRLERKIKTSMRHLANGISQSSLFCLKMNRCQLLDGAIAVLIQRGILHCENLQELYLGGNHFGMEGLSALEKYLGFPTGCSLVTLGLSNTFREGPDGGLVKHTSHTLSRLYSAFATNKKLRILHLASNFVQDEDIVKLCTAVAQSEVTMLDLKSNCITDHGACLLAKHLPPKLERLWLLGNPLGVEGAQALKSTLERTHINLIDLRIPIYRSFELVPELEKLQEECHYFTLLNQGGRRILLDEEHDNDHHSNRIREKNENMTPLKVPIGLWALVLERVNRVDLVVPWGQSPAFQSLDINRAEVIYYLLKHASMLRQHR